MKGELVAVLVVFLSASAVATRLDYAHCQGKGCDPKKFFDDSFVCEMQSSDFIDSLYK